MFAGLRIEKKEKKKEKKEKKEKKKEKGKEKSKNKDSKKHKKKGKERNKSSGSDSASSASVESSSEKCERESGAHGVATKSSGQSKGCNADSSHQDWMVPGSPSQEGDFFSNLGTERKRQEKLKPDPDKPKVSEREYNPFLRGELSSLPTPETTSKVPSKVCVGDGGAGWRKRAQKRSDQAAREASQNAEVQAPASSQGDRGSAPVSQGRGSLGSGWKAQAPGRPSRSRSRSKERSSPRRRRAGSRSRSKSRSVHRDREAGSRRSRRAASRSRSKSRSVHRDGSRRSGAQAPQASDDADQVMQRMQAKYSSAKDGGGGAPPAAEPSPSVSKPEESKEPEDANALGALAMQAMLSGDMARYEELNKRLEALQADMAPASTGTGSGSAATQTMAGGQRVKVIEEVDAAGRSRALVDSVRTASVQTKGRNKRGMANAVPGRGANMTGFYEDDNVSLDDLVRRERIEGQQDYDSNFAKHIMKRGSKFRMLDQEEDEAYALGWYEDASKKLDAQRRGERSRRQEQSDKDRIQVNLSHCTRCMESKKFGRRDAIMSVGQHTYLCIDGFNQCILPGQVFIAPLEHHAATTDVDEDVQREIRNYQKSLVRFFEEEEPPRAVIFVESAVHRVSRDKALLGAGPHTAIVAYPVEPGLLQEARAYWRKAFDEAECEFTVQHKKVIETDAQGGVRKAIPKGFAYVHATFSLGGGYAHVVEDTQEFPKDFAQQTIAGMSQLTVLDRAYTSREAYRVACQEQIARFRDGGFDWTRGPQE